MEERICKNCKNWAVNKFAYATLMPGGWSHCECNGGRRYGKKTNTWSLCECFENK
jgi:hypothetical protein